MPVQSPELSDMLLAMMESRLASLYVACPGIIQSYDLSSQTVDVTFGVKQAYQDEQDNRVAETLPIIQKVPVTFVGSGSYSITWPINKGDSCLLVHCDKSIDTWLGTGGVVDPGDDRRHDLSDVVAIPGLRAYVSPIGSAGVSSNAMVIGAPSLQLGNSSAVDAVIKGTAFYNALQLLLTALNTFAGTCTTTPSGTASALATAVTAFETASAGFLSTIVKVS